MLKELLIEKTPKYTEILPISQKRISYRPFVVREEKNLMIAKETSSFENLMTTIQEVINSCADGLPHDDCKSIPFCDLEYIFLKIREKKNQNRHNNSCCYETTIFRNIFNSKSI